MTRCAILECMYKAIKDSLEWGIECKSYSYGYFVDGVVAVTEAMLEEVDKPTYNMIYDIADKA